MPGAVPDQLLVGAGEDAHGGGLVAVAGDLAVVVAVGADEVGEQPGVAGVGLGAPDVVAITVALAFFPRVAALLIAIPGPVAAAYITVLLALLFVQGMRMVVQDGLDHRKAAVVGIAFWIGVGFQNEAIFPDLLGPFAGVLLGNGMTSGAVAAVVMMLFIELTAPRRRRLQVPLEMAALPAIEGFLRGFASRSGWNGASADRLASAGEETLSILLQTDGLDAPGEARRLSIAARMEGRQAELEFVTALAGENIEDQMAYLGELPPVPDEHGVVPPPAVLCSFAAASEVSRHRHRHGATHRRGRVISRRNRSL